VLALNQLLPELASLGKSFSELKPATQHWIQTVTTLAGGGTFIVTSLLWASALAHLIDGQVRRTVATLLLAAVFSWFGIIHSPLPSSPILSPAAVVQKLREEGRGDAAAQQTPYHWSAAYFLMAVTLLGLSRFGKKPTAEETLNHQ
jgi:AGZA family xanthine/uracil permease-like MFS transporter